MRLLYRPDPVRPTDAELTDEDLEDLYALPNGRHVRLDFVCSLDAVIEVGGRSGGLNGEDDHRVFATLRALADVVLVGSGTVAAENYGPARLSAERLARRRARGQAHMPPIAVTNRHASLDPASRLFTGDAGLPAGSPRPIVLCAADAPVERRRGLGRVADVVECGDHEVNLGVALDALAERGLRRVLCEGGPTLATSLVGDGLVDELCLSQAAVLAGPGGRTLCDGMPFPGVVPLRLGHLVLADGFVIGRWELQRRTPEVPQ
jgi:riboflavin biosynthesis pyrimidine reductase